MVDVRPLTAAEIDPYIRAEMAGFHHVASDEMVAYRRDKVLVDRTLIAVDGSEIVGTADSFPCEVTVPGGAVVPIAAVSGVTVVATHRRQGLLRRMMAAQLDAVTEPVAVLIAAEAPIYGRFGYGRATEEVVRRIDTKRATFVDPPPPGRVSRCSAQTLAEVGPAVFDRYRRAQAGQIAVRDGWWDWHFVDPPPQRDPRPGDEFFVVTRDADGVADGYATYFIAHGWENRAPRATLTLGRLIATSDDAYRVLWHHCITVDWVTRVDAYLRPPVEPLGDLLVDLRAERVQQRTDFMWARVRDVPTALSARRYRVADRIVIEVVDGFGGYAAGRFVVDGGPDGASCTPAGSGAVDLTVDVADLSAAYLGGTALWTAAVAGRVEEHRVGAAAAFDRLFLTDVAPWCTTDF